MRKITIMFLAAAVMSVIAGCSSDRGKEEKLAMGTAPREYYEPLTAYRLALRTEPQHVVYAGEPATVTFTLRNSDKESLRIDEWFSNEPDNVIVYCQPWFTGMNEPDENAWIELSFDPRRPPWRYPLELMPGNQVLVTKELPFVAKMTVLPGTERRFFLRGKLNLTSVSVASPVSVLIVRPGRAKASKTPPGSAGGKDVKARERR